MLHVLYTMFNPKPETIQEHIRVWSEYPDDIRDQIRVVIVDDCSNSIVDFETEYRLNILIARINDDIYWNLPGARNLAFMLADNDWCVNLDMDHFISTESMREILDLKKELGNVYRFKRTRNGQPHTVHRDSFIMHRSDFWKMEGYDEDMCGCRGANEDLIDATMRYHKFNIVQTDIVIENNEFHGKVGGAKRDMVAPNYVKLRQKLHQIKENTYKKNSHIRFDWTPVRTRHWGKNEFSNIKS